MRTARILIMAMALIVSGVATASAGTKIMATAPGSRFYPLPQTLTCSILNLNTTSQTITIEGIYYDGTVVVTNTALVAPQASLSVSDSVGTSAWCRFTVNGSTKKYRAAAIYNDATGYTVAHPAR